MDIYASNLEEVYFGYKTNNNCYAITFEEETVSLVRRVNGLNQVIKSAQIVGKQHIIKVISNESLHVFVDGLDIKDGELRFRHSVDIEGIEITPVFVHNFIHGAITISDLNYLALNDGLHGKSVAKALSSVKYS